jgi:DNA-binding MarR family transcriptional regulator
VQFVARPFANHISAYTFERMTTDSPGLGTRLRRLIELLDGGVSAAHDYPAIDYRPRFTPVMRALADGTTRTIGEIAQTAGLSQPAATQTVALMARAGLVRIASSREDARRRAVRLTPAGVRLMPRLQTAWDATHRAAEALDAELAHPLSAAVDDALAALEARPFAHRIAQAAGAAPDDGSNQPRVARPRVRRAP